MLLLLLLSAFVVAAAAAVVKPAAAAPPADGNCLFRAIADQISGDGGDHRTLRARTVAHMQTYPDDFSPFIEDDEKFEGYLDRMGQVFFALLQKNVLLR